MKMVRYTFAKDDGWDRKFVFATQEEAEAGLKRIADIMLGDIEPEIGDVTGGWDMHVMLPIFKEKGLSVGTIEDDATISEVRREVTP